MSDTQRGLRTAFLLGLLVMVAGTVGATYVVAPAGPASASSAGSPRPVTVAVRGTLLVRPAERPGLSTSYAVALGSGEIVPVRGSFPPWPAHRNQVRRQPRAARVPRDRAAVT